MTRRILLALACVCTVVFTTATPQAQALDPIRYTLRFPAPHTHYVNVEASSPTAGRPEVELMMAVWTPGSYLVREYARNVEGLAAFVSALSSPGWCPDCGGNSGAAPGHSMM